MKTETRKIDAKRLQSDINLTTDALEIERDFSAKFIAAGLGGNETNGAAIRKSLDEAQFLAGTLAAYKPEHVRLANVERTVAILNEYVRFCGVCLEAIEKDVDGKLSDDFHRLAFNFIGAKVLSELALKVFAA